MKDRWRIFGFVKKISDWVMFDGKYEMRGIIEEGKERRKKRSRNGFASLPAMASAEKEESIYFRIASYRTGSAFILGRGLIRNNSGLFEDFGI